MRIGLLNWSGHKNLGDDAMRECLEHALKGRGHEVYNQGESPAPHMVDAYFWGGGTLISANGVWPPLPDKPTIGFGIGVCEQPPSNIPSIKSWLRTTKTIFARDVFSYLELIKHGIPAMLSFDPVFLMEAPLPIVERKYVAVNIIRSEKTDYNKVRELLAKYSGEEIKGYAIGHPQDEQGLEDFGIPFTFYDSALELVKFLQGAKATIATRLHATVFSYMAGVPKIESVIYDPKITRFREYVMDNRISPEYMRKMLNQHIDYALSLLAI